MGVDPGLQKTGWGVLRHQPGRHAHVYMDSGVVRTLAGAPHMERLQTIGDALQNAVAAAKPELICIERVFINSNPKVSLMLGEARGVAVRALMSGGVPIHEITALQIKQSVTGAGRASKQRVALMVAQLLGDSSLASLPHDCTDALACALAGAAHLAYPTANTGATRRRRGIPTLRQLAKTHLAKSH